MSCRTAIPGFSSLRLFQSIGGPICLLGCLYFLTFYRYSWWPTLGGVLPAAILGFYLWRASPGLWFKANLDALYCSGRLDGHLGDHVLDISEDGITEKNVAGNSFSRWREILNIHSTEKHTFFVTLLQRTYVLPAKSVTEGSYPDFVAQAKDLWLRNREQPSDRVVSE